MEKPVSSETLYNRVKGEAISAAISLQVLADKPLGPVDFLGSNDCRWDKAEDTEISEKMGWLQLKNQEQQNNWHIDG